MRHFLLYYDFAADYEARRDDFRERHLIRAWAASKRGDLVLAGALIHPTDTGIILFKAAHQNTPEDFARGDPYVVNGLVSEWRVREWITTVGADTTSPITAQA